MEQETIRPHGGEPLTGEEALRLTYRLERAVSSSIYFAQTLLRYATPEDISVLETLIELSNHLRIHVKEDASEAQHKQHKYLKDVSQSMLRASHPNARAMDPEVKIRRMFKIAALKKEDKI